MVNSIKTLEEIEILRNWFKWHNDKSHDFHLLYFDLGINTCYTTDELQHLKWSDILDANGAISDYVIYNGYMFFLNNSCKQSITRYRTKYATKISSDYIFNVRGSPISFQGINKMLRKATKECKLP